MNVIASDLSDIDVIQPLWEKLDQYNKSLHRRFFGKELRGKWDHTVQDLQKRSDQCQMKFDVVKINGKLVGYCISSINRYFYGEIVSIYVLPEFRSRGIGACLMNEHIKWLRGWKAKSIFLYVHPCNIKAIQFYWRFNFFAAGPLMELCETEDL